MIKKKKKITERELNSFPFLSIPLKERLRLSNAIDLTNNHVFDVNSHYCTIKPVDKEKKLED